MRSPLRSAARNRWRVVVAIPAAFAGSEAMAFLFLAAFGVVLLVVNIVTIAVGFVVLFVAWVWMIYRVVKGWLKWNDGQPVFSA